MSPVPLGSQSAISSKRWIDCRLTDACVSMDYGLTASATDDSSGVKFLRITDIVSGHINWDTVPYVTVNEEIYRKYQLRDGDIVIARTGASTGASAFIQSPPKAVFASYLVRLNIKPKFDSRFLAYYLKSEEFWSFIRGVLGDKSAQPNASASTMGKAPLLAPELKTDQRRIAHILGALDDKIELNRRMNSTLEEMAQALFKSWFVDFEPVRAKMEGRWRRGESLPGMPAELYDLFPDQLMPSELGEVPKGWELRAFESLLDDVIGGDWGKEDADENNREPVSIIRGTDIPSLAVGGIGKVPLRYTTERKAARRKLRDGDIIIEVSGGSSKQPTGRSLMITQDMLDRFPGSVVCASFCRRLRPTNKTTSILAAQHLEYIYSIGRMWYYQVQSTGLSNFQTKRFLQEEFVLWASDAVTVKFSEIVEPIIRLRSKNESQYLSALRDALIPELVSGRRSIEDL